MAICSVRIKGNSHRLLGYPLCIRCARRLTSSAILSLHTKCSIQNILHQRKLYNYKWVANYCVVGDDEFFFTFSSTPPLPLHRILQHYFAFDLVFTILCNVSENGCARFTRLLSHSIIEYLVLFIQCSLSGKTKWDDIHGWNSATISVFTV